MPQSLSNVNVHLVFSTKDHRPLLDSPELRGTLHAELGGTSKTLDCPSIIVDGVAGHVRILARQSRTILLVEWVKELKRVTSIWIKDQGSRYQGFWPGSHLGSSLKEDPSPSPSPRKAGARRPDADSAIVTLTVGGEDARPRLSAAVAIATEESHLGSTTK